MFTVLFIYKCHGYYFVQSWHSYHGWVYDALLSKEKMKQLVVGSERQEEGLVVYEKTQERNFGGDMKDKSKSKNWDKIYNDCKKNGHIKSNCYKL